MNIILVLRIFLRSLFLQSVWNYERMQNVGFAFSIIPFIKHLYRNNIEKRSDRIKVHFGFFNTHPYFANLLLGIVMRLEEKYLNNEISSEEVLRTKTMLAGPIAAIGDRFIWSTWRVFCGIIGVSYFLCSGKDGLWYQPNVWVGILLFLLIYNSVGHLPLRFFAIYWGYRYSSEVIQKLSKFALQSLVIKIRTTGVIILLVTTLIYTVSFENKPIMIFMFWINVLLTIIFSKRFSEMIVFYILFLFNTIIFLTLKI